MPPQSGLTDVSHPCYATTTNEEGHKMQYKATLTFKDSQGEYTRTIEHDDHNLFQAMVLGTIQGSLSCKATLISIEM